MKQLHIVFGLCLFLAACTSEQPAEESTPTHEDHLIGLAKPIRMAYDTTTVYLEDFFGDLSKVESVIMEGDSLEIDASCGCVHITTSPALPLGALTVNYASAEHHIPMIRSEKQAVHMVVELDQDATEVAIAGSINGWNPSATPLYQENGNWACDLILDPGLYEYQVVVDGEWKLDEKNPLSKSNGMGGTNSYFVVGGESSKPHMTALGYTSSSVRYSVEEESTVHYWWEDTFVGSVELLANDEVSFQIPAIAKQKERSVLRIWITNDEKVGNDLYIPLKKGEPITSTADLTRADIHAWTMYFLLVDRFADGNDANNDPVDDPSILPIANHFGGDFSGINEKVASGYFEDLGMNTIWVSPITRNAEGAWGLWDKGITSTFSGYHGYWPVSSTEIDPHFGTDSSFRKLIDDAHAKDMNLIVDYVANHVHQNHPVYQQHPDWATDLYLPDGSLNTERWDEYRLTTWFDTFLPTLDLEREEVYEPMTDSAIYWLENYPIDGFRHDATKHIPEVFWRTLTQKAKQRVLANEERPFFQIGETYGSPELISSYVSTGQLDAQFDFNLYDAMVDAFAKDETSFENLDRVLQESLHYYGSHHLMGNITGNQDRARFISYADGAVDFAEDAKLAGWTRDIENQGAEGYDKLSLLHAFLMTTPGIPCVYYGDEIGMPGGNDPDNRRMMIFDELSAEQQATRDGLAALAKLRNERMSLIYGDIQVQRNDSVMVFTRTYLNEATVVVISKGASVSMAPKEMGTEIISKNASVADDTLNFNGAGYYIGEISK
ncbi:alpha-amylase family glycosyl hydrolase [Sanyastnella coralliicola]|uniref:alpha-amylase family glycosyl hydrolase n=1 Tax=Sanyastnella coralliicola TaxID=3069118 RepID=UPI0027BA960D|nr:alpha-amylase family glycosyl hydrolase [Longitalea sp. SCSIO 12813]